MSNPTEPQPDRSDPDRTGSDRSGSDRSGSDRTGPRDGASSEPTPVWDGAVPSDSASEGPGSASADERPSTDGSASAGGSGSPARSTGPNGRAEDAPPRLPPPWERVPTGGAETAATPWTGADGPSTPSDRYGSTQRLSGQSATVTEDPGGRESAGRPVSPELGDARTTEVDSRSIWTGQPNPPPGGFPAGWPRNRRPRQANLQLKRLDPWSVLKIALVLAVVLYLVWMVAVGVLYGALDGIGVWDRLNGQYADLVSEQAGDKLISAIRVFGVAAVVGAVNSLLVAVAFSVSAFIYNVSADLVGGIEVTLSERD